MQTTATETISSEIAKALDDALGVPNFVTCRPALSAPAPPAAELYLDWLDRLIRLAEKCRATVTEDVDFIDFEWQTAETEIDLLFHLLAIRDDKSVYETWEELQRVCSGVVFSRRAERQAAAVARNEAQETIYWARVDAYKASQSR